jgi:hypothetical protein
MGKSIVNEGFSGGKPIYWGIYNGNIHFNGDLMGYRLGYEWGID